MTIKFRKAMPDAPPPARPLPSHAITRKELDSLSPGEMLIVHDALYAARAGLLGVLNQPNTEDGEGNYNPAGRAVEVLLCYLDEFASELCKTAENFQPVTAKDADARAWLLLQYYTGLQDDLLDLSALAARLAAEHADIAREERLSRPADILARSLATAD